VLAYEIKYLRGPQRQALVASAIGQAVIYGMCGYPRAGAVLFDLDPRVHHANLRGQIGDSAAVGVSVTIRSKIGSKFRVHESATS
jgi:hypothetical protein